MRKSYILIALLVVWVLMLASCGELENIPSTNPTPQTTAEPTATATVPSEEAQPEPSMGVGERGDYDDADATTAPMETQPESTAPETTQPEGTTPETTQPEENTTEGMTFSQYNALTPEEQEAFISSFPTLRDFIDWWNAAKAAEESGSGDVITGDPSIDLGDYIP